MKKEFAITSNVKKFITVVDRITNAPMGIDRMALIYGDPGLGKTETASWYVNNSARNAVFIRTYKLMTGRWLLETIVTELGETPAYRTRELFEQIVSILAGTNRLLILDEVDYLARDSRVLETLRDIHDTTNAPMLFIGMEKADKKLRRFRHLWRRFSDVEKFLPLERADVAAVLAQICDFPVEEPAVDKVCGLGKITVALLYRLTQSMEAAARRKGLSTITGECLPGSLEGGE